MITGIAIGYLVGTATAFALTLLFGMCITVNNLEGDLASIYDPETLDINAKNDSTGTEKEGEPENGRRTDDGNPAEAGSKDE